MLKIIIFNLKCKIIRFRRAKILFPVFPTIGFPMFLLFKRRDGTVAHHLNRGSLIVNHMSIEIAIYLFCYTLLALIRTNRTFMSCPGRIFMDIALRLGSSTTFFFFFFFSFYFCFLI